MSTSENSIARSHAETNEAISEEFQKVSTGWKMVAWNGRALYNFLPDLAVFVEQRFGLDGTLTETIWNAEDHVVRPRDGRENRALNSIAS
jgi:hypothetical protein